MFSRTATWRYGLSILAAVLLVVLAAAPASAQGSDPKIATVTAAVDFTNTYMFRGIRQDDTKLITWPYVDLGLALYSGDGGLKTVGLNIGTWNSLHTGDAGSNSDKSGLGCGCGKLWYERDFYATFALGFDKGVSLGTTYTAYTSPNDGFTTVKEIAFKVSVDDSSYLGRGALKPYALVAFEMDTAAGKGQADGGLNAGRYLELGVGPGWSSDALSITVPIKVGLSLSDYYEFNFGTSLRPDFQDSKFGYLSTAVMATVPLKTPPSAGAWNIHGGVELQTLGDSTKAFNNGDRSKVIGTIGIGLAF
jgi:hypothetical protein